MFTWKRFGFARPQADATVEPAPSPAEIPASVAQDLPLQKNGKALFDEGRAAYHDASDPERALPLLRQALVRFDSEAERNEQLAAVSCNDIGLIQKTRGELAEAEVMFQRASEYFERVHGQAHHDTATTMHNLGATLLQRGNVERGGLLLTRSFELIRRFHAHDKMDLMHAYQHQGMLHRARGDVPKVLDNYRDAIEIGESFLAPGHHELKTLWRDFAAALGAAGELHEALVTWNKLLAVVPDATCDVAEVRLEIAQLERQLGRPAEALEAYRRAGALYTRLSGLLAEPTVRASMGEAMALVALQRDRDAEQILSRLIGELRRGGAASRRLLGEVASEFGEFHSVRRQFQVARAALEDARDILADELGANHHLTCEAVGRLAHVLEHSGDPVGAEALFRSVVQAVESWSALKEGWVAVYGDRVARLCGYRQAYAEAEVWLRRAIRNAEIAWGADAVTLGDMQYRLGILLQQQDDRGAAWSSLMQALSTFRQSGALERGAIYDILYRLVRMISADTGPRNVQAFLRDMIGRLEPAYPDNHPNVIFLYRAMGESLHGQGEARAALPWLERALAMQLARCGSNTDVVLQACTLLEDVRIVAGNGSVRPWTAGLPIAAEGTTWQLRLSYATCHWEGVAKFAEGYLEAACEVWLADLDDSIDPIHVAGPVAKYEATCGAHEHLVVVTTDSLILSVLAAGPGEPDSRVTGLESRLLLALARNPDIVIDRWALSAGKAGAQDVIAEGNGAELVDRLTARFG
jgi:tetratricopeptide (TPR) repeat protein